MLHLEPRGEDLREDNAVRSDADCASRRDGVISVYYTSFNKSTRKVSPFFTTVHVEAHKY